MRNIPKRAYFYWGGEILPYLRYMTIHSFRHYNLDWEIVLCVPKKNHVSQNFNWPGKENKTAILGKDYMQQVRGIVNEVREVDMQIFGLSNDLPEVTKSDFYRLHLLSDQFGLWLDIDIIFFKPMSHAFLQTDYKAYVCYQKGNPDTPPYHSIGLLMSAPGNSTWAYMQYYAKKHIYDYDYQAIGSPFYKKYLDHLASEVCNFSIDIVYPIRWPDRIWERSAEISLKEIKPETIGVHWYGGHPLAAKHQLGLTQENFRNQDNIVSHYLKQIPMG